MRHLVLPVLLALTSPAAAQVVHDVRIAENSGGLAEEVPNGARFGTRVAALGDLDDDGIGDVAVGAPIHPDGGVGSGAVYVLFMAADGTVRANQRISATSGGFPGTLGVGAYFGSAVAGLGDLDGDGIEDLAVGCDGLAGGGTRRGGVFVCFLNANGTVKSSVLITNASGGLTSVLDDHDRFGTSLALVGDLSGDGTPELAVGARGDDDGATDAGAVYLLSLASSGMVVGESKISATSGGLVATFAAGDEFGMGVCGIEDLDGDLVPDMAVGMPRFSADDDGQLFVLRLNGDGTVKSATRIGRNLGGFSGSIARSLFGWDLALGDDHDGDGLRDLVVGAPSWGVGGNSPLFGSIFVLFLQANGTVDGHLQVAVDPVGFTGTLKGGDFFGGGLALLDDYDGNGTADVGIGAFGTDVGGLDNGAVWILSFRQGDPVPSAFMERTGPGNVPGAFVFTTSGSGFTPPRIGGMVRLQLDTTLGTGHDTGLLFAFDGKVNIQTPNGWTLLCADSGAGFGELLTGSGILKAAAASGLVREPLPIPNDGNLVGFEFTVQGLLLDSTGTNLYEVCNAWDVTVGL